MRLKWSLLIVIGFLVLLVFSGGVALYKFSQVFTSAPLVTKNDIDITKNSHKQANTWFEKVATLTKKDSILPTNLMFIEIDDNSNKNSISNHSYELLLNKCDFYSFFCISKEVKRFGVDITIISKGDKSSIYLNTNDKEKVKEIVLNLQKYNIYSKIKGD